MAEAIHVAMMCDAPEELNVSLLRTSLCGWCTAARLGLPVRGCLFGCAGGVDEQSHYLLCVRGEVVRVVALCYPRDERCMEWLLLGLARGGTWRLRVRLVFDLLLHAFDARRHGAQSGARQLVLARLKELRRRHTAIRTLELRSPV